MHDDRQDDTARLYTPPVHGDGDGDGAGARHAFLLALSDALRGEPDADAVADRSIRMLIEHMRLDRSYIVSYRLEDDRAWLVHQRGNHTVPPLPDVFILSDYPAAFRAIFDQTFVIEDQLERQGLSQAERRSSGRLGMRAMVAATLRRGEGRPLWSMVAISSLPRRWTRGELALVEEVAERTWAAMEHARAQAALGESEARHRALALASADVLYRMSPDWSEMRQLDGRGFLSDTAEPSGSWLERYIHPDDQARVTAAIADAVASKRFFELEHRVLRADGTPGWTHSRAVPMLDAHGAIMEWVGAASDVTARREAEAALRESQARATALVGTLPGAAAFIVDHSLRYQLAEGEALREAGFTPERFVGRTVKAVLGPEVAAEYVPGYRRVLAGGTFEAEHDAHGHTFLTRGTPLRDAAGRVTEALFISVDITARKTAEAALRESEIRYRTLFETMGQGYCDLELVRDAAGRAVDQRYREFNPAFERIFGIPVGEARGRRASEVFPGLEPWWTESFDRIARTGVPKRIEHEVGALGRWYEVQAYPRGGDRLTVLYDDITDRKAAEAALRESEARQAFLLDLSDALRPLANPDDITGTATRLLGERLGASRAYYVDWPPGEDYGEVARDYAAPGLPSLAGRYSIDVFRSACTRLARGDTWIVDDAALVSELDAAERQYYLDAGVTAWVDVPLVKQGELQAALCLVQAGPRQWTATEISLARETAERCWAAIERARAEAALRELNEALEQRVEARTDELVRADLARRQVLRQLVTAQEDERRRVSRELHDSLGQLVTGLLLGLKALPRGGDGQRARIEDLERLTDRIAREMQHMAVQLRPPALDNLGLRLALQAQVEEWSQRFGIACDFHSVGVDGERFAAELETTLYRVVQEGLNNVVKHAGATRVSLVLERRGGMVGAILEDDGRGFDVDATLALPEKARRLGLRGMRERVALLGGALEIESAEGAGTTLYVRIPLPGDAEEDGMAPR